ncbi:serine hydrolase [Herbaspirillum sp. alder98]|uniref:serine hydrolase n=1 Tax=Herbaspirillum sp. alder98 TaxID=2913096 RepID=UPI001CD8D288|nr:serine hydrolase [Herbaspirillum sp. alder98]MCA1323212.1 class A beta-lactamase-related serine hydrolase [Herbaspirillum sp. alder98]
MDKLWQDLNSICDEQSYVTGWYVKNLLDGSHANRLGDYVFPTASTRKVSILMAVLREVNRARLRLDEPIVYEERLRQGVVSGTFKFLQPGFTITLQDALVQMMVISDNVCTAMIMERISLDQLNDFCRTVGMHGTVHRTSVPRPDMPANHPLSEVTTTTPIDQGHLFDLILRAIDDPRAAELLGCTAQQCKWAIEVMSWQKLRTKIASRLPEDTFVAHKGGTGKRGRMDCGIVYRKSRPLFIMAAYTDEVPKVMPDGLPGYFSVFNTIGRMARACWDELGARQDAATTGMPT